MVKGLIPTDIAAMVYKGMSNFNAIPRSTTVLVTGDQASVDKLDEPVATPTGGDVLG